MSYLNSYLWNVFQYIFGAIPKKKKELLKNYSNEKKILEIGCGTGFLSEVFTLKSDYTGIDTDNDRIKFCKLKYPQHNFYTNFQDLKFKYDFIVLSAIIHHLSDKQLSDLFNNIKKYSTKKAKIHIMELLKPKTFIQKLFIFFFERGNYIRDELSIQKLLKLNNVKKIKIKKSDFKKFNISFVRHLYILCKFG
jgi:cyclopropane fatty-acyl-phospholipid synthase-like methyltransferase